MILVGESNRGGNKMGSARGAEALYIAAQSLAVYTLAAISPKAMTNPVLGLIDDRQRVDDTASRHCLPLRAAKPVNSGTKLPSPRAFGIEDDRCSYGFDERYKAMPRRESCAGGADRSSVNLFPSPTTLH